MHVLFDESNSLSENDIQDENFELGLIKKDCLPNHEQGKNPKEGSGTGPDSNTDQQGYEQTGEFQQNPICSREQQIDQNQVLERG